MSLSACDIEDYDDDFDYDDYDSFDYWDDDEHAGNAEEYWDIVDSFVCTPDIPSDNNNDQDEEDEEEDEEDEWWLDDYDPCENGDCEDDTNTDTETDDNTKDCAGVRDGEAYIDECGQCVGGTTGKEACAKDCMGVENGKAYTIECNGHTICRNGNADTMAVIGISGGKDSTVVAMLSKLVFGDNVYGVIMPNGVQGDVNDAIEVCETLGIEYSIVNIQNAYNSLIGSIENKVLKDYETLDRTIVDNGPKISDKAKTNIPPRLRMTTLYAIAQTLGYRVIGTGNASERYIGWFTKYGDGGCDLNPIAHLTCTEVVELGKEYKEIKVLNMQ